MKTICTVALKGGVGKSALSVILAQYAALKKDRRVLFIDTDGQGNSSLTLKTGEHATVSEVTASQMFSESGLTIESDAFVLLQADTAALRVLEQQPDKRNAFATNFRANIEALADQFDLCVVDTAPSTDIRLLSVLVSADFAISPLQLNQEAVSGMGMLLNDPQTGCLAIKEKLNQKLDFLGFLPSAVIQTNNQKTNLTALLSKAGQYMFTSSEGQPMMIRQSTAVPEAMTSGQPLFSTTKTTAREAWKHMVPVFDEILDRMFVTEAQQNA